MAKTFRQFLADSSPPELLEKWGSYLIGGGLGFPSDTLGEAARIAYLAPLIGRAESPDDALPYAGADRNMEAYPGEAAATYRTRLLDAWNAWVEAGTKAGLDAQLSWFGYPDAVIYEDKDWTREPQPWWSQFWIFLPEGTHTFTAAPVCGGGAVCGTTAHCGITGDDATIRGLRAIANKWRPAHVLCRSYVVEVTAPTCGTGVLCGGGAICGGVTAGIQVSG